VQHVRQLVSACVAELDEEPSIVCNADALGLIERTDEAFRNLRVVPRPLVKEPVAIASSVSLSTPPSSRPFSLEPHDWQDALRSQERPPIVFDCRNYYETVLGSFESPSTTTADEGLATVVPIMTDTHAQAFSEVAKELERRGVDREQPVLLACTGGIRCERMVRHLRSSLGYSNATALRGGIVALGNQATEEDSVFHGANYVFDRRGAVQVTKEVMGRCQHCSAPCGRPANCRNPCCGAILIQCDVCRSFLRGACSPACALTSLLTREANSAHAREFQKSSKVRRRAHSMTWGAVTTGLWLVAPHHLEEPSVHPCFWAPGPMRPGKLREAHEAGRTDKEEALKLREALGPVDAHEEVGELPSESLECLRRDAAQSTDLSQVLARAATPWVADDGSLPESEPLRRYAWWSPSERSSLPDRDAWRLPHRVALSPTHSRAVQQRVRQIMSSHMHRTFRMNSTWAFAHSVTSASPPRVAQAIASATLLANAQRVRHNASSPVALELLSQLAFQRGLSRPADHLTRVLDLGTFAGLSASALAHGLEEAVGDAYRVVTVDHDSRATDHARELFASQRWAGSVEAVLADTREWIESASCAAAGPFDLVFVDAGKSDMKGQLQVLLGLEGADCGPGLVRRGGMVIVDDADIHPGMLDSPPQRVVNIFARAQTSMNRAWEWVQSHPAFDGSRFRFVSVPLPTSREGRLSCWTIITRMR
jgi:predicted sulfurtransferase/predicted O-methyltransferase YrrM